MPGQPKLSSVYIEKAIRQAAIGYGNGVYIAGLVCPIIPVPQQTGKYFVFDDGEYVTDAASTNLRPGGDAPRSGYTVSNEAFDCQVMAQAHEVPDTIVDQADEPIRPLERGIRFCMERILVRRERFCADILQVASTWGTGTDPTPTAWSNLVDSDPATDVQTGLSTVLKLVGYAPNTLIMGQQVYDKLVQHPDAIDRIKYTQAGIMTPALMATWLGVERILVGGASYNSAKEGASTSREFIWGKNALLCYCPPAPAIDAPASCYMFQFEGVATRQWREESPKQTVVEARVALDCKRTAPKAGYYFNGIVA